MTTTSKLICNLCGKTTSEKTMSGHTDKHIKRGDRQPSFTRKQPRDKPIVKQGIFTLDGGKK